MNVVEHVGQSDGAHRLIVRCLGRFQLEDTAGQRHHLRTRKARAVIAVLALGGRPMSRDALADLLWSDRGPVQARASLRQCLFELQHAALGELPVIIAGRDEVAFGPGQLVTDIDRIGQAATDGDWPRLVALLSASEAELLAGLDGIDAEFDSWLRIQRAREPARTLAVAVEAAKRCRDESGPRAALDIVAEVIRLDPANEAAARLALAIDHQLGDSAALHRRFAALRQCLRDDYDAEPSAETTTLFQRLTGNLIVADPGSPDIGVATVEQGPQAFRRHQPTAPLLAVLVSAIAALMLLAWRDGRPAEPAARPVLLAVLPFDEQPRADAWLAEGLWDDTRAALSRNAGLRVLGRATTRAMAERRLAPAAYRRRFGVDYLLEGTVRRSGARVLVSASLTRTSDGIAIWDQAFGGRLGDALALQEAVASAIEGRLRGRLAPGGGRRAQQIATSPDVYTLYTEARSLIRDREAAHARRAEGLLRQAVALDPNYAPAWAALAEATYFGSNLAGAARRDAIALSYVRRALALAPALAPAHAVKAKLLGEGSAVAEKSLERAVELDPGYAEAWLWLGNIRNRQYRIRDAALAYERAADIDPIWPPAAENAAFSFAELGDWRGWRRRVERTRQAGGNDELLVTLRLYEPMKRGDYSTALEAVLKHRREHPGQPLAAAHRDVVELLTRLGYLDEAAKLDGNPSWLPAVVRSQRVAPADFLGGKLEPRDVWNHPIFATVATRAMVNLGRTADVVRYYREAFPSRDQFVESLDQGGRLLFVAPTLAVALRAHGLDADADYILAAAARPLQQALPWRGESRYLEWELARIRAAQGRDAEAAELLRQAIVERGWLPTGMEYPLDLAEEPAFRNFHRNAGFQALRSRILDHIARERAELGPLKI